MPERRLLIAAADINAGRLEATEPTFRAVPDASAGRIPITNRFGGSP